MSLACVVPAFPPHPHPNLAKASAKGILLSDICLCSKERESNPHGKVVIPFHTPSSQQSSHPSSMPVFALLWGDPSRLGLPASGLEHLSEVPVITTILRDDPKSLLVQTRLGQAEPNNLSRGCRSFRLVTLCGMKCGAISH